jgi:hypothetical protein
MAERIQEGTQLRFILAQLRTTCAAAAVITLASCSGSGQRSATPGNNDETLLPLVTPNEVIGVNAPVLNRVGITGTSPLHRSQCGAFAVALTDPNLVPVNADANLLVSLSGAGSGAFFSDSGCATPASSVTIPAGSSTATFHFRSDTEGSFVLTPSASSHDGQPFALTVAQAPAASLIWSGSNTSNTVTCAALNVGLRDVYSNPFVASESVSIALDDSGASGSFYSDSNCSTSTTSVNVAVGASSVQVYYRQTVTGNVTLAASSTGLTTANHSLNITAAPPAQLAISGSATLTTASCSPYSIRTRDALGAVANAAGNLSIQLDPGIGGGSYFSDSGCSSAITTAQITMGTNSTTVYFRQTTAGSTTLTVSSAGLTDATLSLSVSPAPANSLTLSGPTSITTVACSAYVVNSRDASNALANVASSVSVSLSDGGAGGDFFTASNCGIVTSSVVINAGANSATVYYRKTSAGPANLSANATGFSPGLLSVSATQGPATTLSFSANPGTAVDTTTCVPYTITLQDAYGNVANANSNLTIQLSGQGSNGAFYGTANCSSSTVTSRVISAGTSSTSLSYRKTSPGAVTLTASRTGMSAAIRDLTVVNAPASRLVYTSFTTPTAPNTCRSLQVQLRDPNNNAVTATASVPVELTDSSGAGTFHTASNCSGGSTVTSVNITAGQSTVTYYYLRTAGATVTLTAASTGLTSATSNMVISSGSPNRLAWTTAPSATPQNVCTQFVIAVRDEQNLNANVSGATSLSLTGLGADGQIFSNSNCTNTLSNQQISNGQSSLTYFYRKASTGTVTLDAQATGLTGTSRSLTVSTGTPSVLAFTAGNTSTPVNTCTSYSIATRDEAGVQRNVTGDLTVDLTDGAAGGTFFSNATCTTAITQTTITNNTATRTFYYRRSTVGAVTLRAAATGYTAGTRGVTVTTGNPTAVAFSAVPSSVAVGDCAGYTVTLYDNGSNAVTTASNRTVDVSTSLGGATLYADANCTLPATNVMIASGSSEQQFFLQASLPGSGAVQASSAGLTGDSESIDVP